MTITLYNSKTRRKEAFQPIDPTNVRMYVCGPTVYDRAHLGNARPVLVFDVLYRLLRYTYREAHVTYVRNFTDVDDKINASALARQNAGDPRSLEALIAERTEETIAWYHADMDALGALRPSHEPRATQYIGQMIEMIQTLIRKGFAYSKPITYGHNSRAVYFKSEKAPEHSFFQVEKDERYGELSGRGLDEMISGAKAEIGEGKLNPMDFVLWKPSTVEEPGWYSPWGYGRPGWHIECSAMSKALLGETFDIHGGGLDLQFPHHENEIAQSCCANGTDEMARVWMHNEMLQVEGKKMSKSLGNFFTVRDLLDKGVAGEVIRFVMLSTHYRKPMDWTEAKAREAETILRKVAAFLAADPLSKPWVATQYAVPPQEVVDALSNDLNTSLALTFVAKYLREMNEMALVGTLQLLGFYPHAIERNFASFEFSASGIPRKVGYQMDSRSTLDDATHQRVEELGNKLHELRINAKQTKDFSAVDAFRSALSDAGIEVQMSKDGVHLTPTPTFDPSKLDGLL